MRITNQTRPIKYFYELEAGDIFQYPETVERFYMVIQDINKNKKVVLLPNGTIQRNNHDVTEQVIICNCELIVS